ncbi:MAG: BlaI/MecI/CopY family transcriptional regulator [Caulobacterales bacterium]
MRITAAESQVMEALWRESPRTVDQLLAEVGAGQGWGDATVKTLINRLLKKKALASARVDGRTQYRALVSRADYLTDESQGLLDRLFGGELAPLVAHYANHRPVSAEELARLKALIEALGDDG